MVVMVLKDIIFEGHGLKNYRQLFRLQNLVKKLLHLAIMEMIQRVLALLNLMEIEKLKAQE